MTIIVKPRAAPVDTSDEVITAWLNELLGSVSWPQFEATENGDLMILNTKFSMRIGIFMTMPTQAIFAQGMFLRMRHRKEFDVKDLHTLIADKIDACLYRGRPSWKPKKAPTPNLEDDYLQKMIARYEDARRQCNDSKHTDHLWREIIEAKNKIERMKAASSIMPPMYSSKYDWNL